MFRVFFTVYAIWQTLQENEYIGRWDYRTTREKDWSAAIVRRGYENGGVDEVMMGMLVMIGRINGLVAPLTLKHGE